MRLSKWSRRLCTVTANSSQLFEINHMAPFSLLSLTFTFKYIVARNFSHHMNVLFLIPRHGRPKEGVKQTISLKHREERLRTKSKSSVKWKCEKEIVHLVHNYSVTGREPRKNVLLTCYKLTSFVSNFPVFFFQRSLPFSCYIFTSDLTSIKTDVLTLRT